jgi:hypothetical protein
VDSYGLALSALQLLPDLHAQQQQFLCLRMLLLLLLLLFPGLYADVLYGLQQTQRAL